MLSTKSIASTPSTSPFKRALFLSVFLFTVFLIVTGLYARYGYAFALGVYEQQQLANVERRTGSGKLVEYEDYLRVDPTNLYMRGLLINQLIEFKNPWRALEVALEGVAAVPPDQRPIAKLLVGRAQIARGKLDEAEATYKQVIETLGESGEAHYGIAHIAAARGDFSTMRAQFEEYRSELFGTIPSFEAGPVSVGFISDKFGPPSSTPDFFQRVGSDHTTNLLLSSGSTPAQTTAMALFHERMGNINEAFSILAKLREFTDSGELVMFLRGVYEEEQGNRDAALDFYRRAAEAGDALGKFAAERLGSRSDSAEE